jgi:ribosomal protein S27E
VSVDEMGKFMPKRCPNCGSTNIDIQNLNLLTICQNCMIFIAETATGAAKSHPTCRLSNEISKLSNKDNFFYIKPIRPALFSILF